MRKVKVLRFGKTEFIRESEDSGFPHIFLDKGKPLQGWYKNASDKIRPRPCFTEAILTQPYGGYCPLSCAFCYVNLGIRGYRSTKCVTVCKDYPEQVQKQISKWFIGSSFYITPFHEPFNCLEPIYGISQKISTLAVDLGLPIFFLSRLVYPDWAIELLRLNPYSYAQKSIITSNATLHKKLSPKSATLEEQYHDISKLALQGIYVSIQVNPVFLGITDEEDILKLIRNLGKAGANHIIVKFVEVPLFSWKLFLSNVEKRFGIESKKRIENLLIENQGSQKTIPEQERRKLHNLFLNEAREHGMTYATCYEYDSSGKTSIGKEFCTADQCHGKAVPIFYRNNLNEKFKPFDVCEKTGCLYCRGKLCQHPSLIQAKAMRDKDYRIPLNSLKDCS